MRDIMDKHPRHSGETMFQYKVCNDQIVIFIDIVGFSTKCQSLDASQVGKWIAQFYERVQVEAYKNNVRIVERRGDCCIGITDEKDAPHMAQRALAFCRNLYRTLKDDAITTTNVRIGLAMGDVSVLMGQRGFRSVQGDAVNIAARLQVSILLSLFALALALALALAFACIAGTIGAGENSSARDGRRKTTKRRRVHATQNARAILQRPRYTARRVVRLRTRLLFVDFQGCFL